MEKKLHTCPPSFWRRVTQIPKGPLRGETQSDTEESFSLWNSHFVFSSVELCEINHEKEITHLSAVFSAERFTENGKSYAEKSHVLIS